MGARAQDSRPNRGFVSRRLGAGGRIRETGSGLSGEKGLTRRPSLPPMHALKSIVAAATVFVVLGLAPPRLHASNVVSTWTSATSGSWNINGNWTNVPALGGFPNDGNLGVATYDAVISPTGPAYTLTLATAITVENLLLNSANATLSHTTGTLTANTGFNLLSGTYQLNGGTLANTVVTVGGGT